MATKFTVFTAIALLAACHLNHVHGQSRSRSEVFGDVVEYFETLTNGVLKVRTAWPTQLMEDLEGITNQLKAWKDTRDDTSMSGGGMQQPSFLMHR